MEQSLGKRIAQNRKRLGMTQDKLAEQLGVTAQAVSKWENDQACPDISMLPRLAEIFSTSTDVLLGLKPEDAPPVRPAELISEQQENADPTGHSISVNYDGGKKAGLGFAIWILVTGGLLLISNLLHLGAGFWDICWPSGLLIFGLWGLYPRFSFLRLGCTLFGGYFLLDRLNRIPLHLGKDLLFPIILLLFGVSLLVDALNKPWKSRFSVFRNGKHISIGKNKNGEFRSHCNLDGEHFDCSTSFGEDYRTITLPKLSSGEVSVSFGELKVDLSGCETIGVPCVIDAHCSFGELDFLVPSRYRVEPNTSTTFAAVEIDGTPDPVPEAVIAINCNVSFGEIQITYI